MGSPVKDTDQKARVKLGDIEGGVDELPTCSRSAQSTSTSDLSEEERRKLTTARTPETLAYHGQWFLNQPPRNPRKEIPIPPNLIPEGAVDISFQKKGKLYKVLLFPGKDDEPVLVKRHMTVAIQYNLWFANDPEKKIIDSSKLFEEDNQPMEFTVGEWDVMKALDEGVQSMTHKGERMMLVAHFDYAYGRNSQRYPETCHIPNESFVCFEVELVDAYYSFRPEGIPSSGEDDIILEILKEADLPFPTLDSNCVIFTTLEGFYEEKMFLEKVTLPLNPQTLKWGFKGIDGAAKKLPKSLAQSIRGMVQRDGEFGKITLKETAAFPETFEWTVGDEKIIVPALQPVKFMVGIWDVEEVFDPFVYKLEELITHCEELIRKGMRLQRMKSYEAAAMYFDSVKEYLFISEYKKHLKEVPDIVDFTTDILVCFACLGLGKVYVSLGQSSKEIIKNFEDAIGLPVIQSNPQLMATLLFERGLVHLEAKDYDEAIEDFEESAKLLDNYFDNRNRNKDDVEEAIKDINKIEMAKEFCGWFYLGDLDDNYKEEWEIASGITLAEARFMMKEAKARKEFQMKTSFVFKYYPPK